MTEGYRDFQGGLRLHPSKIHLLRAETPTEKKATLSKGFGIYLSHDKGLRDIAIYANNLTKACELGPMKIYSLGEVTEDGQYAISLHCHGANILGGEEFAAAVLALAETNSSVTASRDGDFLTYSSKSAISLLPTGRIHGAYGEIFSIRCTVSAPQNSGTAINAGFGFTYISGVHTASFDCETAGESVTIISTSSATKQISGLRITSTGGTPRVIDLKSFGVYRGTVAPEEHEPYWGERVQIPLTGPLVYYNAGRDVIYPMRGYTERRGERISLADAPISAISLGATYPTYRVQIPERLWSESGIILDHFSRTNETTFKSTTFKYMRSPEGDAFYISASNSYKTVEKFSDLFHTLDVRIQIDHETPLIETFDKIEIPTRKGLNYVDLETLVVPSKIDFTYY